MKNETDFVKLYYIFSKNVLKPEEAIVDVIIEADSCSKYSKKLYK